MAPGGGPGTSLRVDEGGASTGVSVDTAVAGPAVVARDSLLSGARHATIHIVRYARPSFSRRRALPSLEPEDLRIRLVAVVELELAALVVRVAGNVHAQVGAVQADLIPAPHRVEDPGLGRSSVAGVLRDRRADVRVAPRDVEAQIRRVSPDLRDAAGFAGGLPVLRTGLVAKPHLELESGGGRAVGCVDTQDGSVFDELRVVFVDL